MDQMVGVSLSRSYKIKQSSPRLRPVALRRTDPALSSPAAVCESQFQCNSDWGRGISTQNSATSKMQCNLLKTIDDLFSTGGQNRTSRQTEFGAMEQPSPPVCCSLSSVPP